MGLAYDIAQVLDKKRPVSIMARGSIAYRYVMMLVLNDDCIIVDSKQSIDIIPMQHVLLIWQDKETKDDTR